MAQNENLKMVLDLTAEWDKVQSEEGGSLVTGVTVCRSDLLADPSSADAVNVFLKEHKASSEYANTNVQETSELIAAAGIIEKAPVAAKALPYCSITYIDGSEMKEKLSGYLTVLYGQDPTSVGGQLPDDSFYYIP
jgi:NitT/TauT family transport system substrate-binding protein